MPFVPDDEEQNAPAMGGFQPDQTPDTAFAANREAIEPGVMGETEPVEQKALGALNQVATGYGVGRLAGSVAEAALPTVKKFGKALWNTPQEIGEQMGAGEKAAGVTSHLPELRGSKPTYPAPEMNFPTKAPRPLVAAEPLPGVTPKSYPSDKNTFLNMANERMDKFGNKLGPQEITDYHKQIADWFARGKIVPDSPIGAIASKTGANAAKIRGEIIPGRSELDDVYGLSKKLHPQVAKALWEHFTKNAGPYAAAVGTGAIFGGLRH